MTKHKDIFEALAKPFRPEEIKTRKGAAGRPLQYIAARTAMIRLDEVLGPENWRDKYTETKKGLKCRLAIRLPNGEWIAKEDGGAAAGMSENDNDEKSGYSDAFKRAAAKWGVGRYLYRDGVPDFGREPEHEPAPQANAKPQAEPRRERDARPYFQLLADGVAAINSEWQAEQPDAREAVNVYQANRHILKNVIAAGLIAEPDVPREPIKDGQVTKILSAIYGTEKGRTRIRRELHAYLRQKLDEARRAAVLESQGDADDPLPDEPGMRG